MEKKENYSIDDRSNRYLKAVVHWDTYPKNIGLALRGTEHNRDSANLDKCGSLRFFFGSRDKTGEIIVAPYYCHKITCRVCGMNASYRAAERMGLRLLALRGCGWTAIRFLSMNINMKLVKFQFLPDESIFKWKKRVQKIIVSDAKESGLVGFFVILHADRIKEIKYHGKFSYDSRNWSPHFHLIGIGRMLQSDLFFEKYHYNYTMQSSFYFDNKIEISEQLVGRIAYRMNHSSTSFNPSGRLSNSYAGYGLLANCMIKTISEEKIKTPVLSDSGSEYVAININEFIISKQPKRIRNKIAIIERRMNVDIRNTGYPRVKDELDYSYLRKLIFEKGLNIDEKWKLGNPEKIINAFTNNEIILQEIETIRTVQVKGFQPHRISSYELRKDKTPTIYTYVPHNDSVRVVHKRFLEIKKSKELNIKERILI